MKSTLKYRKLFLGLTIFALGFIGILSLLTLEIPLPEDVLRILKETFTTFQIMLLTLINPTLMLLIAVFFGVWLYNKIDLKLPLLEYLVNINRKDLDLFNLLKYAILFGLITGVSLILVDRVFEKFIPSEIETLKQSFQPTLLFRFLYGGITEEILMRFGLMTFFVWVCYKIFNKTNNTIYWFGIVLSSMIFAICHFPIVYQLVDNPPVSLLLSILVGNSIGGVLFGWLYWKKGLESAMISHMIAHVIILLVL